MADQKVATKWRESASLIVCAKSPETQDGYDYKLLMIKRSDRTAIVQNQTVFPGGIYDAFDESIEWLQYFEEFGVSQQSLQTLVLSNKDGVIERPKILAPQGTGCYDRFFKSTKIWAREISLRITAIRETFEEVGVLLCRSRKQLKSSNPEAFCFNDFDKIYWQSAVHHNSKEFLRMCQELKVVPDLWALYEWSCWASPTVIRKGYETAFFITFLNEFPSVLVEETEVKEILPLNPSALMKMLKAGELYGLPPQYYELSRFLAYRSYDSLRIFSAERSKKGTLLYIPILYSCSDGSVAIYPGDDYYTGDPRNCTEIRETDCSLVEFRSKSKLLNRMENGFTPSVALFVNFQTPDGHLAPLCNDEISSKL